MRSRGGDAGEDRADMSRRVSTQRIDRTITGNTTPPPSIRRWAHGGSPSACPFLRRAGATANRISSPTDATTAAETTNMNHHRLAIRLAPGPRGVRVEGEVPHPASDAP